MDERTAIRCFYCLQFIEPWETVFECEQCRLTRYCSIECRTSALPDHDKTCNPYYQDELKATRPEWWELSSALTKWLDFWRDSLISWSLWALNPGAHRSPDVLATHCFVLSVSRWYGPGSPGRSFNVRNARIMSRSEVFHNLMAMHVGQQFLDTWTRDCRGIDTVQVVIFLDYSLVRFFNYTLKNAADRRNTETSHEELVALEKSWPTAIKLTLESGDPLQSEMNLEKVLMQHLPPEQLLSRFVTDIF